MYENWATYWTVNVMVPLLFKSGSLGRLFVTRRYTGIEEPLEFQLIYSNDKIGNLIEVFRIVY